MEELIKDLKLSLSNITDFKCDKHCGSCKLNPPVIYVGGGCYNACEVVKRLNNVLS